MPGFPSSADKSAGIPTNTSKGRKTSLENVFEEEFTHSSHIEEIPSSSEEESNFDTTSDNTLTGNRAEHNVDTSYDEKSAQELLAVLETNPDTTEWKVNDSLLDLAIMEAGQGVRSISNIVGTLLYLLEKGANVNAMGAESQTSLHHASWVGNTAVVEQLIARNANFNIKDKYGWTALHRAASNGHIPVVEILLKSGVDIEQKTERRRSTALTLAASKGWISTVECLLKAGASFSVRDIDDHTPLYSASLWDHVGVVETLLKAGASINAGDNKGRTPLIQASAKGHVGVVETLLKAGASIDSRAVYGETSLI